MFTAREAKKQEAEWRAESDYYTYKAYLEICKDKKRLEAVQAYSKKKAEEAKAVRMEIAEHAMDKDD